MSSPSRSRSQSYPALTGQRWDRHRSRQIFGTLLLVSYRVRHGSYFLIDTNRPEQGAEVGSSLAGRIPCEGSVSCLAGRGAYRHAIGMFIVTEADAAAIRAVFDQDGELSAAIELRRRFPGITDNAKARECARSIAGWTPLPVQPRPVTRLRPRSKDS
jgi:hypothetical protein